MDAGALRWCRLGARGIWYRGERGRPVDAKLSEQMEVVKQAMRKHVSRSAWPMTK
jgi:hypothetical protein